MRILFISHNPPVPVHNGGAQRTNLIHRALGELGKVDLVIVSTDEVANRDELREHYGLVADFVWTRPGDLPPFRWFLPLGKKRVHQVAQTLLPRIFDYRPDAAAAAGVRALLEKNDYDVVVGRYLRPTLKSGAVGRGPLVVLDVDDLDTQVFRSRLNVPGRPRWERLVNRFHLAQIKRLVPGHLKRFDLLWVTNPDEKDAGEELLPFTNKVYLPNIPFTAAGEPDLPAAPLPEPAPDAPPVVLFVGNFYVLPNQMGVDHFVRLIWPRIHAAQPQAVFRIVGSGLTDELRARWNAVPGVEAVGFVDEVRDSYGDCRFSVVPLLSGAGTNIKILESLRFGRTCVVTRFAQRGYGAALRDRESLLVAADDAAFAQACIDLLRDPALCRTLAAGGRAAVAAHYSFERFRRIVDTSLRDLLAARRPAALAAAS